MANNRISIGLKVSAVLFTLAVGVYAIMIWLRPEASVARVKAGMATSAVSGSVLVQAEDPLELRTETGGTVAESLLDLDKRVKADDVLFKMDTGDILLEIEKIQNDYVAAKKQLEVGSAAEVELENAKEKLSNAEREFKRGTVSEADITRIKREIRSIEQRLALESINRTQNMQSLDNQLKSRKRALEKMTIRAPFDGIIAQVYPNTRKGALLGGGTPIARLTTGKNRIEARISEENIAGVKVGQKALVQFLPYDIQQFDAKVIKVLSTVDPETQRYIVHLEVDIDPAKVIPGITGEVSITLAEHPAKAIMTRRALFGNKVYVVKDGRVEERTIKTGFVSMTAVEVTEGLNEGDLVIADRLESFSNGKRVRSVPVEDPRWN